MLDDKTLNNLKDFAKRVRRDIVTAVYLAKSGHIGGALSGADILTVLYNLSLNIPAEWDKSDDYENRDRFILSKGHASALLYSVLAERGFFDKELLKTFRKAGSKLQGHPSRGYLPGIEVSTGSLGQGLGMGVGMALGLKLNNNPAKVVVYLGDGELQEGAVWEAFMQAAHRKLDNIIAIIDRNGLQIDGETEKVTALNPLDEKLKSFGWNVEIIDGHDFQQIFDTLEKAKNSSKPFAIIANTIKGKGVSFMENQAGWHGKAPNDEEYNAAIKEL